MREIVTSPLVHPRFGEDDDSSRTRSGQVTKPASGYPSPQTVGAPTTSAPSSPGGRTVTFEEPGDADVLRKVLGDLTGRGIETDEHKIRHEMTRLLEEAKTQASTE